MHHAWRPRGGSTDSVGIFYRRSYVKSKNCLRELELAQQSGRPIVPINLEMPHNEWAGGGLQGAQQYFIAPASDDMMLYVDCRELGQYETKLRHELLPRLVSDDQSPTASPPAITTLDGALRRIAKLEGELRAYRRAIRHLAPANLSDSIPLDN